MNYLFLLILFFISSCVNQCPPSIPVSKVTVPSFLKTETVYVDFGLKDYVEKSFHAWNIPVTVKETNQQTINKFSWTNDCEWWNGKTIRNDYYFTVLICQNKQNIQQTVSHEISHVLGLKHGYGSNIIDRCYDVDFPDQQALDLINYE